MLLENELWLSLLRESLGDESLLSLMCVYHGMRFYIGLVWISKSSPKCSTHVYYKPIHTYMCKNENVSSVGWNIMNMDMWKKIHVFKHWNHL